MLDNVTRRRIDSARDILVGKVPDPKAQVEQITIALVYKFMDDMDKESQELGGEARFFVGDYAKYSWTKLLDTRLSGQERMDLYVEAVANIPKNPDIPQLFRDIFKGAFLPFRDPRTLTLFLKEINEFTYDHSENLGNAFEYLLSILGSQGDAGQFRTPRHIIDFMVEVVNPQKNETILDPACGTAGFLISAYKYILKTNSSNFKPEAEKTEDKIIQGESATETIIQEKDLYTGDLLTPEDRKIITKNISGYDISPDMVKLALVNLYLHNFSDPNIHEYDALSSDKRWDEHFDVVLANPPFMTPKGGISPHKKFSIQANRAEVLFVDYIAEHLSINGRAGIIVPEGIIFQSANAYKNLRKNLIENWGLYAVVSLPSGVFQPYSGVKTSILFLDREFAKKTDEILFLKVDNDGFDLGAQRRKIEKNDLPQALEVLEKWKNRSPLTPLTEGGYISADDAKSRNLSQIENRLPYNKKLTERAKELRKNMTKAEKKLWYEFLSKKEIRFLRQRPIDNFIVDFYCASYKLVIEIDGDTHFTEDGIESDKERTKILENYGIKVIRFTNDQVFDSFESVCEKIEREISLLASNNNSPLAPNNNSPLAPLKEGGIEKGPLKEGGTEKVPLSEGDLGGAISVAKEKIAENGDYNLTGDRYKVDIAESLNINLDDIIKTVNEFQKVNKNIAKQANKVQKVNENINKTVDQLQKNMNQLSASMQKSVYEPIENMQQALNEDNLAQIAKFAEMAKQKLNTNKWPMVELGELEKQEKILFLRGQGISKKDIIEDGKHKCIHYGEIYTLYQPMIKNVISRTNFEGKIFSKKGDVLIPSTTTADAMGIAVARSLNEDNVILGGDINIVRTENKYVLSDYLALLISTSPLKNELATYAKGVNILHISNKDIKNLKIPLPPLEVQEQIVAEIEQYQKVIDGAKQVVENWKPSPLTPLREGGKGGVGSWEMVELGEVCEVISGQSPEGKYYNEKQEGLPFYQGKTEFQDMFIGEPSKWTSKTTKIALKNDILMSVRAPVGPVNFATQEICIGRGLASIRGNDEKINQKYLFYILRSREKDICGNSGAAFASINRKDIQQIQIPLPPLEVQEQIVAEIESEQKIVNANKELIEKMKKKIEMKIGEVWGDEIGNEKL